MFGDARKTAGGLALLVLTLGLLVSTGQAAPPASGMPSGRTDEALYFDHRGLLDFSTQQVEAPARALILDDSMKQGLGRLTRASELSPELPLVHFALARELGRQGEYRAAFQAGLRGVTALPDHVEGRLWWMGSIGLLLAWMMIGTALVFVVLVGLSFFRHASHDLGDFFSPQMPTFARVALLSACLLTPLALGEGLLGLSCGFFVIGVLYGRSIHRTTLALAIVILATGTFVVTGWAGRAADALEADAVASSSLALVRGRATPAQLAILEYAADSNRDGLAFRSLAIQAGRQGDQARLKRSLESLLEIEKSDPMALILLGNLAFQSGDTAEALRFYNQASFRGNSFELFFNRAQAHAKAFQIQEFEDAMAKAQALDAGRAAQLTGLGQPELVLDPGFPMGALRERLWLASDGSSWVRFASSRVAPGFLGQSPINVLGIFSLLWLVSWVLQGRYEHSGHCKRCGTTICERCDTSLWSKEVCDSCHFLFSRPRSADPQLRNQRIQTLGTREKRVGRYLTLLSLCVPGFAGLRIRRPDLALISVFLFAGALLFWVFRDGPFPEPWVTGEMARLILASVSSFFFVAYLIFLWVGLSIHRRI